MPITLVLFMLLRVGFWLFAPPNPDEAYYWLWGQHLDFSYYDHPPLQSWLQGLMTALFGQSLFTLRSLNVLTNGIFFYTYYCILQYLYGDRAKHYIWWVVLAIFGSPLYSIMLSLAWHDHLAIALSLVGAYLCIRFLDEYLANGKGENGKSSSWRLYGSAIALSLAHITKYNSLFMTLGLLVAIATHEQLRKLFRDIRLWLCAVIGIITFTPVFYWNYINNFQSFRFYASRSVDSGLPIMRLLEPLGFIGISLLMLSPFVAWLLWQGFRYPEFKANLSLQNIVYKHVAFWTFLVPTVLLMAISLISTALYYWNIHAYLLLFPLLPSATCPHLPASSLIGRKKGIRFSVYGLQIFGLLFTALFVWNSAIFPVSALFGKDGDPDGRMLFGWSEVSGEIQKIANSLPEKPLIITSDYRSAAMLAYAMPDPNVTALSKRISQFTLWNLQNVAQQKGKTAILISDQWYPLTTEAIAKFEQVNPLNQVPISRFGVYLKTYEIAIAKNYQP
ncbi:glycosyltransferase family 39 protein [Pseudanabaena sp. FACHB-1998]|uniref:ArnT family glycosyltransferase n=1 Tax=Pseudanabaena sp. FACHB-1998 TaxID=2692858 RepID=UPI0016802C34|nr:glycosyltransferase family 39 protein [Pseudanabaena sp. FACHB-1998]MBD2177886.1 glycosyltransferase family 39 protein [Pseudanabaena sp. FACHB-1998]